MKIRRGFTVVEILIVVLIVGILLAIAMPNFIKYRETKRAQECQKNRKMITQAIKDWGKDQPNLINSGPAMGNLMPKYLKVLPVCPEGGNYEITGYKPICSFPEHADSP